MSFFGNYCFQLIENVSISRPLSLLHSFTHSPNNRNVADQYVHKWHKLQSITESLFKCLSHISFTALYFGNSISPISVLLSQRHKLRKIISARVSIIRTSAFYTDTGTHSWSLDKCGKSNGIVLSLAASFRNAEDPGLGPVWTLFNAPITPLFRQFLETFFGLCRFLVCEYWTQ